MSAVADVEAIRACFPALARVHNGHLVAYFDGPGGTQVPLAVAQAMTDYLLHHNATAFEGYSGGTVHANWIYANTTGISGYGLTIDANRIYSNSVGIVDTGYGRITNNIVYANTNQGIRVQGGHTVSDGDGLFNNTVLQLVGEGVRLTSSATDVVMQNNLVRVDAGYGVSVDNNSQSGLVSNYNLLYRLARRRYDLLYAHEEGAFLARIAGWLFRVPYVYDMHSSLPLQITDWKFSRSPRVISLFQWVEKVSVRGACAVVAISPAVERAVRRATHQLLDGARHPVRLGGGGGGRVQSWHRGIRLQPGRLEATFPHQ